MDLSGFEVEVIYAPSALEQVRVRVWLAHGESLEQAIVRSGIPERFAQVDLRAGRIGVFGRLRERSEAAKPGDRIEIYRELRVDPKAARRTRAARKKLRADVGPG